MIYVLNSNPSSHLDMQKLLYSSEIFLVYRNTNKLIETSNYTCNDK